MKSFPVEISNTSNLKCQLFVTDTNIKLERYRRISSFNLADYLCPIVPTTEKHFPIIIRKNLNLWPIVQVLIKRQCRQKRNETDNKKSAPWQVLVFKGTLLPLGTRNSIINSKPRVSPSRRLRNGVNTDWFPRQALYRTETERTRLGGRNSSELLARNSAPDADANEVTRAVTMTRSPRKSHRYLSRNVERLPVYWRCLPPRYLHATPT